MQRRSQSKQAGQASKQSPSEGAAELLRELQSVLNLHKAAEEDVSRSAGCDEVAVGVHGKFVGPLLDFLVNKVLVLQGQVIQMNSKLQELQTAVKEPAEKPKTSWVDTLNRLQTDVAQVQTKLRSFASKPTNQPGTEWVDVVKKLEQDVKDLNSKATQLAPKVHGSYSMTVPSPTPFRLQPLPNSGNQLAATTQEAVAQLYSILQEIQEVGVRPIELVSVKTPRSMRGDKPTDQAPPQSKPGTVFTIQPAPACSLVSQLRQPGVASKLSALGWSIRLHLPAVQYRCKCALYNLYKEQLQGKSFSYSDQYTKLVVEGGETFSLSAQQLEAVRAGHRAQ